MTQKHYRCCLIDGADRTLKVERLASSDDASALLQAERLLASSQYHSAELWDGGRLVGRWGNSAAAASDRSETSPGESHLGGESLAPAE